jgi:Carboxypeptidase regulatory-like domain
MTRQTLARLVVVSCVLLLPAAAWAQAGSGTIAGVVRDTSGAVLPGVTVEAASPALIEKVRSVITDSQGQYKIVDLRPGLYTVSFTLSGFSTFRRDGIELTTGFTATINADMTVGAVEETITVTGESPIVDTQNVQQQVTIRRDLLDALPTPRRTAQLVTLLPGAQSGGTRFHDVGGVGSDRGEIAIHGQRLDDMTFNFAGMDTRQFSGGSFPHNVHLFQELVVETAAGSAESTTGGVQVNLVPKDGGNHFSGTLAAELTGPSLQADNISQDLRKRGLDRSPSVKRYLDVGGGLGGPVLQDKLWFFAAHRRLDRSQYQQGNYYNKRHGTLFYEPDLSRIAFTHDYSQDYSVRLTWQAAGKHKFAGLHSQHPSCQCAYGILEEGNPFLSPEAAGEHHYNPQFMSMLNYTYPVTNRLLIQADVMRQAYHRTQTRQFGGTDARVTVNDIAVTDLGLNLNYGSRATGYQATPDDRWHERLAVSYVTGSHNFKAGVDLNEFSIGRRTYTDANLINQAISYTFRNQVPVSVTIHNTPRGTYNTATDNGIYAQDQWTIRKLTLNLGLRYAVYDATIPEFHLPAGPWVPARDFPALKGSPHWENLSPRVGAAYDLFGNGRSALKVSLGRYSARNTGAAVDNPAGNQANNATRNWDDTNRNYVPDCVLGPSVPGANGECGALSDLTFGQIRAGNTRFADDAKEGFNRQSYNWQSSVAFQHELRRGLAVNVGYFRTWYGGFLVTDNLAVTQADYDPFCITAPVDPRLPGGGGNQFCGLYDIRPGVFGRVDNLVTQASHYGKQTEIYNGIDVTLNARLRQGVQVQGGLSTGRTTTDNCFVVDSPQQARPGFCDVNRPWTSATDVKFSAVYSLPWNIQTSAIYQNIPGFPIAASLVASNAQVLPSLGRNLGSCRGAAVCNGTVTIDLIPPNTLFEDRIQQLDLRFSRIFRMRGMTRLRGNFDVYNIFNAATLLNENTRYGAQWLQPVQVMGGRLVKFSGQLDF